MKPQPTSQPASLEAIKAAIREDYERVAGKPVCEFDGELREQVIVDAVRRVAAGEILTIQRKDDFVILSWTKP